MLERERILLWKSNLFETSLHLAYFHHKYCLSYRWGKLLRRNIVIFMAVEALGKNHLLPRKELGPEIIISPRAREGRARTISTRAVALLQYFSCACLGASYFITSIFIYRACLTVSYMYIYCSKFALISLRSCPAYVYELSLAFVIDIFKAQSDV